MGRKSHRKREGIVYSTNPDYDYQHEDEGSEQQTLPPEQQKLKVYLDNKNKRKGKEATLVNGFKGSEDDLKNLAKELKTKCAAGGSVKDGEILIQGDVREKAKTYLEKEGYKVRVL